MYASYTLLHVTHYSYVRVTHVYPRKRKKSRNRRDFNRMALLATVALSAAFGSGAQPSVYWQSLPTLSNETLLVAGAGLEGAHAFLCRDSSCSDSTALPTTSWKQSVQAVLPTVSPPSFIKIEVPSGDSIVTALNAPEVWWTTREDAASEPLTPRVAAPTRDASVVAGQRLRVYGRALGWVDETTCTPASAPSAVPATELTLAGVRAASSVSATCYDASFDTTSLPLGTHTAAVKTQWGASRNFSLTILAPRAPPPSPTVIDVDQDAKGDVKAALAAAAALEGKPCIVRLGPHAYNVTEQLVVPNKTTVVGAIGASVLAFTLPLPPEGPTVPSLPAAVQVGSGVSLLNLSITIDKTTPTSFGHPPYVGVWMPRGAVQFVARGINVTLSYINVSNAFRIEGHGFELVGNTMLQQGSCGGAVGDAHARRFQPSVTLYIHAAREGLVARNTIGWRCSAFDMDVSERIQFEENRVVCLTEDTVPHGNSVSMYDYSGAPWSRLWHITRNNFSRPPCRGEIGSGGQCGGKGDRDNWFQRETLTTDGSGAWGVGRVAAVSGTTINVQWTAWTRTPVPGCRLLVIRGPGTGHSRTVLATPANGTLVLDAALDGNVVVNASLFAVVTDAADKLIVGNTFLWSNVVQAYGSSLRLVMADNTVTSGNFRVGAGAATGGIMGAAGECYHGVSIVYYTEFLRNTLRDSNGLNLRDGGGHYPMCGDYMGPWIRWSVVRNNAIGGASLAMINATQPGELTECANVAVDTVTPQNLNTSDVVAEHQVYSCPSEFKPASTDLGHACAHCVER